MPWSDGRRTLDPDPGGVMSVNPDLNPIGGLTDDRTVNGDFDVKRPDGGSFAVRGDRRGVLAGVRTASSSAALTAGSAGDCGVSLRGSDGGEVHVFAGPDGAVLQMVDGSGPTPTVRVLRLDDLFRCVQSWLDSRSAPPEPDGPRPPA